METPILPVIDQKTEVSQGNPSAPATAPAIFNSRIPDIFAAIRSRLSFLDPFPALTFVTPKQRQLLVRLFPRGLPSRLRQSKNVGDCYFVAALHALEQNPIAPYIFAETIERAPDGFSVLFRGANKKISPPVFINNHSDLEGQEAVGARGRKYKKHPIEGQLGDRILERAFARHRKENKYPALGLHTMFVADGGKCEEALRMLLGDSAEVVTISAKDSKAEELLIEFGENPDGFVITATTPSNLPTPYFNYGDHREFGKGRVYFMDSEHFFYQMHAFTVESVDPPARTVTVVNPHDTKNLRKTIRFRDFFKYFDKIEAARLMETEEERCARMQNTIMYFQQNMADDLARALFPNHSPRASRVTDSIFNILDGDGRYIGYSLMLSSDESYTNPDPDRKIRLIKMERNGGAWKQSVVWEKNFDEAIKMAY